MWHIYNAFCQVCVLVAWAMGEGDDRDNVLIVWTGAWKGKAAGGKGKAQVDCLMDMDGGSYSWPTWYTEPIPH